MSSLIQKYNLNQPVTEYLTSTLVKVGKESMRKILSLEFNEEPVFSNKEREVLINLFM